MDFVHQSLAQPSELEESAHFDYTSHNYIEAALKYYHLYLLQGNLSHLITVAAAFNALEHKATSQRIISACIIILEGEIRRHINSRVSADDCTYKAEATAQHRLRSLISEMRSSILSSNEYDPPLASNLFSGASSPAANSCPLPSDLGLLRAALYRSKTPTTKGDIKKVSAVLDRVDIFRGLAFIAGWINESIDGACTMSLVDDQMHTVFDDVGSACFYTRDDVNNALGSPNSNRHGFSSVICLDQIGSYSRAGKLALRFDIEGIALSYLTQPILEIMGMDTSLNYLQFTEYILGSFKGILESGTQWFKAVQVFNKRSVLAFSSYFKEYIHSKKSNHHVHWLSSNIAIESPSPSVSFIYVQLGEISIAKASLTQILQLETPKEIIIVNNSPEYFAETFHLLSRYASCSSTTSLCIINCVENLGFSAACNIGASYAKSPLLFFHNNDLYAESKDDYQRLIEIATSQPLAIHSSLQYFTDGTLMQKGIAVTEMYAGGSFSSRFLNGFSIGRNQVKGNIVACSGSLLVINKSLFESLSGFSEEYIYAHFEDVDLCLRANHNGYPILIEESTRFYHAEGSGTICAHHLQGTTSHINRLLFTAKWDTLGREYLSGPEYIF